MKNIEKQIIEILKRHENMVDNWNKAVFPPYINVAKEIAALLKKLAINSLNY